MNNKSRAEDCNSLAKKTKKELGKKIDFRWSTNTAFLDARYLSIYRMNNGEKMDPVFGSENSVPLHFKFCDGEFMRVCIGSNNSHEYYSEQLAALSDLYLSLREEYGEPTVFYTTRDDDDICLQWMFTNKKEEIERFKNGTCFDDAEIDKLIVIDNSEQTEIKRFLAENLGLPFDLLELVDDVLEDYLKHKTGKIVKINDTTKEDGVSVVSLDEKTKKIGSR